MFTKVNNFFLINAFCIILTNSQIPYDGPWTSSASDYFEQELANIDTSTLPELTCLNYYTAFWYSLYNQYLNSSQWNQTAVSFYLDSTNATSGENVRYYRLSLTSDMKLAYPSSLSLSTCCELDECNFANETKKDQCNDENIRGIIGEEWYYGEYNTSYLWVDYSCSADSYWSLDTVLFLLQEKKGKINVMAEHDDSTCGNSEKSYIDLSTFTEGIISFFLQPYNYVVCHVNSATFFCVVCQNALCHKNCI